MNNPFNKYNGDNSMTYNVTDDELNANYEPEVHLQVEWLEEAIEREMRKRLEQGIIGEEDYI